MSTPADTHELSVTSIEDHDIPEVISLWQRCGLTRPWNDPAADIAMARREANSTVLLGREKGTLLASVLVGHDGHRGWVYYVAVDPNHRLRSYGRNIMSAAEHWLRARGIEKLQLMIRAANDKVRAFYRSLDFLEQERVVFAKWLDGREPTP